jgi:hypothetical protein
VAGGQQWAAASASIDIGLARGRRPVLARRFTRLPGTRPARWPNPGRGDWLDDEMAGLRILGVDVLVCLLTSAEPAELDLTGEPDAAPCTGLQFVWLPTTCRPPGTCGRSECRVAVLGRVAVADVALGGR